MRVIILIIISLLLVPFVSAETTFFDQDDAFIMGNSPTGGITRGSGGCTYKWNCTDWGECLSSGKQTRNCTNIGTCPNTYKTQEIEQNCIYTSSPKIGKEDNALISPPDSEAQKHIAPALRIVLFLIIAAVIGFVVYKLRRCR